MNIEIEAKMRLPNREQMEAKLRDLGAVNAPRMTERNTFFDTPQGRLKSGDQGLRVRQIVEENGQQTTTLTHKGPRAHGKLKSRSETETTVSDPREAAELLHALGYESGLSFEKRRSRWDMDGCRVELDTLPLLGDFIEIEGPSDEAVLAAREKLGLAEAPLIKASYIALLSSYQKEHNLNTRHIRFDSPEPREQHPEPAQTTS